MRNGCTSSAAILFDTLNKSLAQHCFLIYINDLDSGVIGCILKFAVDNKIYRGIRNTTDNIQLQRYLDTLVDWSTEWLMLFNERKCKVLHVFHLFVFSITNYVKTDNKH